MREGPPVTTERDESHFPEVGGQDVEPTPGRNGLASRTLLTQGNATTGLHDELLET